jgi:putative DNA primase/helicase
MGQSVQFTELDEKIIELSLNDNNKPSAGPILTNMSGVEVEQVEWLWNGLIPKGKLTIIEGNPGDGKTWLSLCIAAAVSDGHYLPNPATGKLDALIEPGPVIYMTSEDGIADTIKPRLEAAAANHSRVYVLEGDLDQKGGINQISLKNLQPIKRAIIQVKPSLLVIDPIQGYLGANVDLYRANEIRPLLANLSRLAEQFNFAVVCVRHLTKSNSSKAIYRGMGSVDFSAAARSILLVGKDPDRPDERAIIQIKNSLGLTSKPLGFVINEDGFQWTGASSITVSGMLRDETDDEDKSALEEAKAFLIEILGGKQPVNAGNIFKEAKEAGISEATLKRAKRALGVESVKPKDIPNAKWQWFMVK